MECPSVSWTPERRGAPTALKSPLSRYPLFMRRGVTLRRILSLPKGFAGVPLPRRGDVDVLPRCLPRLGEGASLTVRAGITSVSTMMGSESGSTRRLSGTLALPYRAPEFSLQIVARKFWLPFMVAALRRSAWQQALFFVYSAGTGPKRGPTIVPAPVAAGGVGGLARLFAHHSERGEGQ